MFSRSGASTLTKHQIFKSKFGDIQELIADARIKKTHKGGLSSQNSDALANIELMNGDISA